MKMCLRTITQSTRSTEPTGDGDGVFRAPRRKASLRRGRGRIARATATGAPSCAEGCRALVVWCSGSGHLRTPLRSLGLPGAGYRGERGRKAPAPARDCNGRSRGKRCGCGPGPGKSEADARGGATFVSWPCSERRRQALDRSGKMPGSAGRRQARVLATNGTGRFGGAGQWGDHARLSAGHGGFSEESDRGACSQAA